MQLTNTLVLALIALPASALPGQGPQKAKASATIPFGKRPVLDGRLSKGEWADATRVKLASGASLWMKHDARALYVGIRGASLSFGHICLARGDEVLVLHASASLGMAHYKRGKKTWKRIRGFKWSCRDGSKPSELAIERAAYLEKNGWLGTTMRMGKAGECEFAISAKALDAKKAPRLAVVSFDPRIRNRTKLPRWPTGLDDDSCTTSLLSGLANESLTFEPSDWMSVQLAQSPGRRGKKAKPAK